MKYATEEAFVGANTFGKAPPTQLMPNTLWAILI